MRRALRDNAALVHHQHAFAQRNYFFTAVRDIENWNAVRLIPAPQIIEDLRLGRGIESGKRFVEQEHAGVGHQSPRQRHALAFSAGDFPWALLAQVVDAELLQHRGSSLLAGRAGQMCESIFGVLLDREMREQCEILQDISHAALRHRNVHASARIKQDPLTHRNSPRIRGSQPGHAVEQRGFSRSRRAKQDGKSRRGTKFHIERELALCRRKDLANNCA